MGMTWDLGARHLGVAKGSKADACALVLKQAMTSCHPLGWEGGVAGTFGIFQMAQWEIHNFYLQSINTLFCCRGGNLQCDNKADERHHQTLHFNYTPS